MFTNKIFISFTLFFLALSCTRSTKLHLETYTLKNGLKVVLAPTNNTAFTTVSIQYGVGGAFEEDNQLGLTHFLEHLMFKTSENLKTGEFNYILEKELGGSFNAMTTYDATIYHETVPSSGVPRVLELEAERMHNLKLIPEEVSKEKLVILEEMRNRIENSDIGFMFDKATSLYYKNYPYGRDLGGKKNILSMPDSMVKEYYKKYYAPNNATLILAGKIDSSFKKEIEASFGHIPKNSVTPKLIASDYIPQKGDFTIERKVNIHYVMLFSKIPAAKDPQTPAFNTLAYLLTGGNTGLLVSKLVKEEKLVSSIQAMADISTLPSSFILIFNPYNKEDIPKIRERIKDLLESLLTSPSLEKDIKKAHLSMATSYYSSLQDSENLAISLAQGISLKGDPEFLIQLQTQTISPSMVKKAIKMILKDDFTTFKMLKK